MKPRIKALLVSGIISLVALSVLIFAVIKSSNYQYQPTQPVTVAELQQRLAQDLKDKTYENMLGNDAKDEDQPTQNQTSTDDQPPTDIAGPFVLPTTGLGDTFQLLIIIFVVTIVAAEVIQYLYRGRKTV